MAIRTFKDDVLDYIKANNAKYTLANLHIHFLNESGSLTSLNHINDITQVVKELIQTKSVQLNTDSTLQIVEPNKSMNNESHIEVEVCKSAPLEEEKQTNDIYTLTASQNMFLKNILEMIKVYFKNSFGIDLTSEQAFDRMAVLINVQTVQNPFSIVTPLDAPNIFNTQGFNQTPYPGQPFQSSFQFKPERSNQPNKSVGETECRVFNSPAGNIARYSEFQDNAQADAQAMRKGLEEAGLFNREPLNFPAPPFVNPNPPKGMREVRTTPDDMDRLDALFQCPEGPFARMYPGFRNMILPQREELPKATKKPVTKRKPKK